jgi:hypothetical protein
LTRCGGEELARLRAGLLCFTGFMILEYRKKSLKKRWIHVIVSDNLVLVMGV